MLRLMKCKWTLAPSTPCQLGILSDPRMTHGVKGFPVGVEAQVSSGPECMRLLCSCWTDSGIAETAASQPQRHRSHSSIAATAAWQRGAEAI